MTEESTVHDKIHFRGSRVVHWVAFYSSYSNDLDKTCHTFCGCHIGSPFILTVLQVNCIACLAEETRS